MKWILKQRDTSRFESLYAGTPFKSSEANGLFMKLRDVLPEGYNAVDLENGVMCIFLDNDLVSEVFGEFVEK